MGEKSQSATYGVIKASTDTNDIYIHDTIFRDNAFGDSSITVRLGMQRLCDDILSSALSHMFLLTMMHSIDRQLCG